MVRFMTSAAILAFAMTATAIPAPAPAPALPDPAGVPHTGNGNHEQFIGGQCLSSADCATNACCAVFGNIGVCSGLGASTQAGKSGCGFGDAGPDGTDVVPVESGNGNGNGNGNGSGNGSGSGSGSGSGNENGSGSNSGNGNAGSVTLDPNAPGSASVGKGDGSQFITGQCLSDADCASACCATGGKCAAKGAIAGDASRQCGFVGTLA